MKMNAWFGMAFGLAFGLSAALTAVAADAEEYGVAMDSMKQVDELVATVNVHIDKAKMLVGDERKDARERQYAAAAEAYGKVLEMNPDWLLDGKAATEPWSRFAAFQKRGDLWKAMNRYEQAREEYKRGFEKTSPAMVDLRSYIQMTIADSYFQEGDWIAAEEAYLAAQKIGLYGDRKVLVPQKLEKVRPLAARLWKERTENAARRQQEKMEQYLGGKLPVGFYSYLYNWKQNKDTSATDLDEALAEMARRGFNILYVGGVSDTPAWQRLLERCAEHRIAVIAQLDFAYLWTKDDNVAAKAAQAIPFIKKYKDHPAIVAFSIKEEPSEMAIMSPLKRYYEAILSAVPDAPLHLLVNYLPPFANMEPPYPGIIGTDRYPFWWEMSGQRATPAFALNWYHTQLDVYYQLAARRGAFFQAVFTASTLETFAAPDTIKKWIYPDTLALSPEARTRFFEDPAGALSPEDRDRVFAMIQTLVDTKNQGWDQGPNGTLRFWKYYRPPANCVRAMAWLGIMEGARSVAIWAWQPPDEKMKNFGHRTDGKPGPEYTNSIKGWDGKGTPQLEEFTEFAGQVQRYAKLIRAMTKDCAPLDLGRLPLGHEPAVGTEGAKDLLVVEGVDVAWQSFSVPGYVGKVVVVVNTAVGTWCDGRSPRMLSPKDLYRIDDEGNAVDYAPFKEPRDLTCRVLPGEMECIDLSTGESVALGAGQTMKLSIIPGGAHLLFLAPKGSPEWARLKQQFEL